MALPVAIQLFSIRDEMEKDPVKALTALSKMGYHGIETYSGTYSMSTKEFRDLCDSLSLKPISAHVSYELLSRDLDNQLQMYSEMGTEYIAIPYMLDENRVGKPDYDKVVENIRHISDKAHEKGIQLLYHNHEFEFEKFDGKYALDYQYDLFTPSELQTELDCCWIKVSGEDPYEYINRYVGRCPCVHIKDYYKDESGMQFRPVGYGVQNVPSILDASEKAGAKWLIVEQDSASLGKSQLECAELSREYLRVLGW